MRRTKIVVTLGPATDDSKMLDKIIQAGIDVVRLNFSHGSYDEHRHRAETVRDRARAHGRQVGIICDLQGPKIRIECFREGKILLEDGDLFTLDADCPKHEGSQTCVGIAYKELPQDVHRGDTLLLDDGRIVLWVQSVENTRVNCKVMTGGELSNKKGINRKGGGLSAAALTDKDRQDILSAAKLEADYLAVSFPRSAADMEEARRLLTQAGGKARLIAKIERAEAMEVLDEIIAASDAVMIARGDLGVEIGDEALLPAQKRITQLARAQNKVVIIATQMMESMINNRIPTRAEVSDVANAVLDGADAVMLSGETAVGKYPDLAVESMSRICHRAEQQADMQTSNHHQMDGTFSRIDETIAMATMYTANHLNVKAIAALTESGNTPLWMSRINSNIPIYALSRQVTTRRQVTLYRGVMPVSFDVTNMDTQAANQEIVDELKRRGAVRDGDLVIITKGDLQGVGGGTNVMKIVTVGKVYSGRDGT